MFRIQKDSPKKSQNLMQKRLVQSTGRMFNLSLWQRKMVNLQSSMMESSKSEILSSNPENILSNTFRSSEFVM